jgi:hypothetical protein
MRSPRQSIVSKSLPIAKKSSKKTSAIGCQSEARELMTATVVEPTSTVS